MQKKTILTAALAFTMLPAFMPAMANEGVLFRMPLEDGIQAPSGITFPTSGDAIEGNAGGAGTIIVKDGSGSTIGTGSSGSDGSFTLPLAPPVSSGDTVTVIVDDGESKLSTTLTVPSGVGATCSTLGEVCQDGAQQGIFVGELNGVKLLAESPSTIANSVYGLGTFGYSTGARSRTDGEANTAILVEAISNDQGSYNSDPNAAKHCANLGDGNWFLPAVDQMAMLAALSSDLYTDGYYWTSTESSSTSVWRYHMGMQQVSDGASKTTNVYRAVCFREM